MFNWKEEGSRLKLSMSLDAPSGLLVVFSHTHGNVSTRGRMIILYQKFWNRQRLSECTRLAWEISHGTGSTS